MAGDRTSQDAKAAPEREGGRPRAGTRTHEAPYRSSLLKMGRRESSSRSKDTVSLPCCQARGTKVRIIHHGERLYRSFISQNLSIKLRVLSTYNFLLMGFPT